MIKTRELQIEKDKHKRLCERFCNNSVILQSTLS